MIEYLVLCGAVCVLNVAIAWAWWIKVRVVNLREDLFAIRDHLFDRAAELGRLDDPAYKACRARMNALLKMASTISVPTLGYIFASDPVPTKGIRSDSRELQSAIDETVNRAARRIARYVFTETATGLLVRVAAAGLPLSAVEPAANRGLQRCFDTDLPARVNVAGLQ
jgi:hypothetical protein